MFTRFAGTDKFKTALLVAMPARSSTIEPGLVPSVETGFRFTSFTDAANQAGMSRRYGGIHFEDGDLDGRTLGHQIGAADWAKALTYFNGTAVGPNPTVTAAPTTTATATATTTAPTATDTPTISQAPDSAGPTGTDSPTDTTTPDTTATPTPTSTAG